MGKGRVQRRLAAILAADVVGYSRLMEQDETWTLTTLRERQLQVAEGEALELSPGFTVETVAEVEFYAEADDLEHLLDGLRMAGLPE